MKYQDKPQYGNEYERWLLKEHSVPINNSVKNHFESVSLKARESFENSLFWGDLKSQLPNYNGLYKENTSYDLLRTFEPKISIKTFDSFFLKTYRHNILNNEIWPDSPNGGWYLPPNWLSQVDDIIRTTISVKYLDGVEYLTDEISKLVTGHDGSLHRKMQATPEGYYAAHLYYQKEIEVPKENFDTEMRTFKFEIQIGTEIKELIKSLLHKYYERNRMKPISELENWQWRYNTEEFVASYMGHILHYVEGMIVQLREKQGEPTK